MRRMDDARASVKNDLRYRLTWIIEIESKTWCICAKMQKKKE